MGEDEGAVEPRIRPVPRGDEDQPGHRDRAAHQGLRQPRRDPRDGHVDLPLVQPGQRRRRVPGAQVQPYRGVGRTERRQQVGQKRLAGRHGGEQRQTAGDPAGRDVFDRAYSAAYGPAREIVAEIYDEVAYGTELRSVVLAERRLGARPMSEIGGAPMWSAGDEVRARRAERALSVEPFTAGVFVATMTARIDEFAERGHPWSEIVNESVIEAVDSLLPYMHARDVAHMVDSCSRTARLGARRWGPRFQAAYEQIAYPAARTPADTALLAAFGTHPVHAALAAAAKLGPAVDIAVEPVTAVRTAAS